MCLFGIFLLILLLKLNTVSVGFAWYGRPSKMSTIKSFEHWILCDPYDGSLFFDGSSDSFRISKREIERAYMCVLSFCLASFLVSQSPVHLGTSV